MSDICDILLGIGAAANAATPEPSAINKQSRTEIMLFKSLLFIVFRSF